MTKRLILLLSVMACPVPGEGQAILNVEALQGNQEEGLHAEVSGSLHVASGNTDLLQIGVDMGLGHLGDRHWVRGYAGMERLERRGKDILDNRYLHIRYNYGFSDRLRSFHFFQLQANENLLLDRRVLVGSGLRIRLSGTSESRLEVGSGFMLEWERLNERKLAVGEDPDTEALRMANLLAGSGPLGDGNRWVTVVYYQPSVERFADYRLQGELGAKVNVATYLQLGVSLAWQHDSRAPEGLEDDDLTLRTGFTYHIH